MDMVKENLPAHADDVHLSGMMSNKLLTQSQTPRQPLIDLKQVTRPIPMDVLNKPGARSKPLTPLLCTPKVKKTNRKIQPSALVYTEGDKDTDTKLQDPSPITTEQSGNVMNSVPEESLDEFVSQVLETCVQKLQVESTIGEPNSSSQRNQYTSSHSRNTEAKIETCTEDPCASNIDDIEINTRQDDNEKTEFINDKPNQESEQLFDQSDILNEDSLLGDTSHYSGCDESLTESTKTEDELLASCCYTPEVSEQPSTGGSQCTDTNTEFKGLSFVDTQEPTPRPTFLEKAALTQRVQEATASVANWIVPNIQTGLHLRRKVELGKAKLVHDMACSPFYVNPTVPKYVERACSPIDTNQSQSKEVASECSSDQIPLENRINVATVPELHGPGYNHVHGDVVVERAVEDQRMENAVLTNSSSSLNDVAVESLATCDSSVSETLDEGQTLIDSTPDRNLALLTPSNGTKSVQCSPILFVTEVGIQHSVENQSIMTSPIAVSAFDASTQHEVETQSVMCSPIQASVCDTSVQHEIEMRSVLSSPMVIPVCDVSVQEVIETRSIMCSPLRFPALDISVQNVAETHSAFCSPMVPRPSQDKSVLMTGPELVDTGVGTDEVTSRDASVTVVPETQTVGTEMDESPMINCATSMTPVKLCNKQGKKLTADDIRKQHPRVLANQLDTLMVENTRLDSLAKKMEKQQKKLVAQEELMSELDEVKFAMNELQEKYDKDMTEWQNKCDKLEAEMAVTRLEHENEILKLKEEYEATDYRDHFVASQKLVREVQDDLEQYTKLVEDMDQSHRLQTELGECLSGNWDKIRTAGNKMSCLKQKLDEQIRELAEQKAENKEELQSLEEQRSVLENDRQEMTEMVSLCKENMVELETELENTTQELKLVKDKVTNLETELSKTVQDEEVLKTTNAGLAAEIEQLKETEQRLNGDVQKLQASLSQKEGDLSNTCKSLEEALESKEKEAAEYSQAQKKANQVVVNLERTLEMREHDIDTMEKELFECREIIYSQLETIKTLESSNKTTSGDLKSLKTENASLRDCCAVLRGKEQELRAILESVQEELAGTKDHATRIIKKQGTEITECFTALAEFTDGMKSVLSNLNQRAGIQQSRQTLIRQLLQEPSDLGLLCLQRCDRPIYEKLDLDSELNSTVDEISQFNNSQISLPSNAVKVNQNSLVSQILNAANSMDASAESDNAQESQIASAKNSDSGVAKELSQSNSEHSLQTLSDKKLDINNAPVSVSPENQSKTTDQSNISETVTMTAEEKRKGENEIGKNRKEFGNDDVSENGLVPQVKTISELFSKIMRVAHLLEKALKSSLTDVRAENDDLNCRMFQCEYAERRLTAELDLKQSELTKSETTIKQLQNNMDEMGERFGRALDHQAEIKQQQLEIRNLRGKVQSLDGEKDLLNEQITELLQQIETQSSGTHDHEASGASRKEVLKLQQKLERYRATQRENDTRMEELSSKAARRIKKLEDNWRKADAEVCRLDELVDTIHRELVGNASFRRDQRLQKLVQLIDGNETTASFSNQQGDLKPVKTAKW